MKRFTITTIVFLGLTISCTPTATPQPQIALATATVQIPTATPTLTETPKPTVTITFSPTSTPTAIKTPTPTRTSTSTPLPPLPALYVDGPYIKRSDTGQSVWLKGVNVDASNTGRLELAKAWNVNVIRLAIVTDAPTYSTQTIIRRIEQAIDFGNKNGIYIILDPHPDNNSPELPNDDIVELMGLLTDRFKDRTNVMYGLYNEPHPDSLGDAKKQWESWMDRGIKVAQAIRVKNPKAILVVPGGRLWSRDFAYYRDHPFPFDNVIFDVHDYTSNNPEYKRELWTWMIGKYPVFIGEWGDSRKGGWNTESDVAYSKEAIAIVNSYPFLVHYAAFMMAACRRGLEKDTCLVTDSPTNDPSPRGQVVFDDLRSNPGTRFR